MAATPPLWRRRMKFASSIVLILLLTACSSTPTSGPRATVELRDGTSVSGMVLSSTPEEVKITTDENVTRTIPMTQVRAIDYGDTPAAGPAASSTGAAPTMGGSTAKPAAPRRAVKPAVPRPTLADVTTDTHVVPAGTEISVQTDETIDGSTAA